MQRNLNIIRHWISDAQEKDPMATLHARSVRRITRELALGLGLSEDMAEMIASAAVLLDIGKARLPDSIATDPGSLSEEAWEEVHKHPVYGTEIIGGDQGFNLARKIARWHHERWDGSGYPDGLKGEEIPLEARIVAVADAYSAMIEDRPFRRAKSRKEALAEIIELSGKYYDPTVVKALEVVAKN